jgi:hypothetical protein
MPIDGEAVAAAGSAPNRSSGGGDGSAILSQAEKISFGH